MRIEIDTERRVIKTGSGMSISLALLELIDESPVGEAFALRRDDESIIVRRFVCACEGAK